MAYDITPKTSPVNTDYENSKYFSKIADHAHEEKMQRDRIKAATPSKYMQTMQAINTTLQTVNTGVQIASNVSKMYDQITEKSFKQEQLEKQNRLKEEIQGAINEHDWNRVTTTVMSDLQTASQMPEYMDMIGRMAKIEGNEGAAAILRSVNTEQQGKLELEDLKNLGKLQVADLSGQYSLRKQALSNQGAMQRAIYNQSQQNERFNTQLQFNAEKLAFQEEGRNLRTDKRIAAGLQKNKKGSAPGGKLSLDDLKNSRDGNQITPTPTLTPTSVEAPSAVSSTQTNSDYINNYRNKINSFIIPLANKEQTAKLNTLESNAANAANAPSKQEQQKAEENKQRLIQNQQDTDEFVSSYPNSEPSSIMYNFKDAKGSDAGSKLNYVLANPDKYAVDIVTEPSQIRAIINGDNNQLIGNTNLADKYTPIVSIAKITESSTGKTQNLYFTQEQVAKFLNIATYNDEKAQLKQEALKPVYTPAPTPVATPVATSDATPTTTPEVSPSPTLQAKDYTEYKIETAQELQGLDNDIKKSPQALGKVVQTKVKELSQDPDALNSFINGPITNVITTMTPEEQQALREYVPQMSIPVKQQIARIVLTAVANKESKDSMIKKIKTILNKSKIYSDYLNNANQNSREYLENFNQAIRPTGYIY